MIAGLNLSSHPFRNRTLPWTVAFAVSLVSLVALVLFITEASRVRSQADVAERSVAEMRREKSGLEEQAAEVRQSIPPEQMRTLEAAHTLVGRKSFSWSQLFADLEASMPSSVRVSRISVREVTQRGGQTRAELEMTVVGRTPADVTGMIAEMGRAGAFSAMPITESLKTGRGEAGYEWTLRVSYAQRARGEGGGEGDNVAAR
ncbi:MAG TPA: hypothetical protein VFX96_02830 [Pyrinomonadaceae bacterium]|nr:hypothetical protein [Pyrinomonadaceae bacterium]